VIPGVSDIMLPLLRSLSNGEEQSRRDVVVVMAREFSLTTEELNKPKSSDGQPVFSNRVQWCVTYLRKAGLLEYPRTGRIAITTTGRSALAENPVRIDIRFLMRYPSFVRFRTPRTHTDAHQTTGTLNTDEAVAPATGSPDGSPQTTTTDASPNKGAGDPAGVITRTPEEALAQAYEEIRDALAGDLLDRAKSCSPAFFERLVVRLLVKLGYGGTEADAAQAVGKSGDGGIDGTIKQDPLGLDIVYVQAKRYDSKAVGGPEIREFVGALSQRHASKGVFITTSTFTPAAVTVASTVAQKVILIDGEQLARLMIRTGVGVSTAATYEVKRVDSDYFEEE
jgi:restriction system protein